MKNMLHNVWDCVPVNFFEISNRLKLEPNDSHPTESEILCLSKIFDVLMHFPDLHVELSKRFLTAQLESLKQIFFSTSEENEEFGNNISEQEKSREDAFSSLLDVANKSILTLNTFHSESKISSEDVKVLCKLVEDLLTEILLRLEEPKIYSLVTLLDCCRVCWDFLKVVNSSVLICEIIPSLQHVAMSPNNFERLKVLRFVMELSNEVKISLVSTVLNSVEGDSPFLLPVVAKAIPFAREKDMNTLCNKKGIFVHLRRALQQTTSTEQSKLATYIIKTLVAFFSEKTDIIKIDAGKRSELLLQLPKVTLQKYWTDFFDLYEVLGEKQIHIIRPFFLKLEEIRLNSEVAIDWYFVILYKMLQHDNRGVAIEGAEKFLDYSKILEDENNSLCSKRTKIQFLDFIENTLLPILKDQVGWIFKEGDEFFRYSNRLGKIFALIYKKSGGEILVTEKIMEFILQMEKGLGAHFLYFLILTLESAIMDLMSPDANATLIGAVNSMTIASSVNNLKSLKLIEKFLNHSLITIDKFIKSEIEKKLIKIFIMLFKLPESDENSASAENVVIGFVGGLKDTIFCNFDCFQQLQQLPLTYIELNTASLRGLSLNQTRGLLRCSLLSISRESEIEMKSDGLKTFFQFCLDINNDKYWSPMKVMATEDIFQCIPLLQAENCQAIKSNLVNDAFLSLCERQMIWKILRRFLPVVVDNQVTSDNFFQIIRTLHTIEQFCNVSDAVKNTLVEELKEFTKRTYVFKFGASNINDFVLCKLWLVLADTCGDQILRNSLIEHVEGFETFFLTGNVRNDPEFGNNELYLETFKENLSSTYYQLKIRMFTVIVQKSLLDSFSIQIKTSWDSWHKYISIGLDSMYLTGHNAVVVAAPFFQECLRSIDDLDVDASRKDKLKLKIQRFVDISWSNIRELRKTEYFWTNYKALVVYMTTSSSMVDTKLFEQFVITAWKHGETIMGMSRVLMEGIKKFWKCGFVALNLDCDKSSSTILYTNLLNMCVSAACYGPTMVNTLKVDFSLWENIISTCKPSEISEELLNANHFSSAAQTRILAIMFIQMLVSNDQLLPKGDVGDVSNESLLQDVIHRFLKINDEETMNRKRYFSNSKSHRLKQRIAQALLVLQHLFTPALKKEVTVKLLTALANDSSQPSVRYLWEWIIVKNIASDVSIWDLFFEESVACLKAREGFGASFATMCLHTTTILENNDNSRGFFQKSLSQLTDLLLGKHFAVRVYSLISFRRIYENAKLRNWAKVIEPFTVVYKSLETFCLTGNFTKIHENIRKDFYVNIFNAETNYNYPIIFVHLPRIAGMANDEIIPDVTLNVMCKEFDKNFRDQLKTMPKLECPYSLAKSYKNHQEFTWLFQSLVDGRELGEEVPIEVVSSTTDATVDSQLVNLQKKMNPWKYLPIVDDVAEFKEQLQIRKGNSAEDGLIVVASLIDRVPNLGGLCRTCEIFGVSKYVLSSLKVLDENEFKNLSVSSHNWVGLLEVPARDLEVFIQSYVSKGYTIIGVEQATESTKLNSYKFPQKSLLLLGNEKFGIPTNLLHFLDQCIEIPQVGFVRSLNVHVTGALCIYAYAAQHVF